MRPAEWVKKIVEADGPKEFSELATIAEQRGAHDGPFLVNAMIDSGELALVGERKLGRYSTKAHAETKAIK